MNSKRVVVVNALSTSLGDIMRRLHKNAGLLAQHGVGYVHRARDPLFGWTSHEALVGKLRNIDKLENYHRQKLLDWLDNLASAANQYDTLLLLASNPWAKSLLELRQRLSSLPEFQHARFTLLTHLSAPGSVIEQRLRLRGFAPRQEEFLANLLRSDLCHQEKMMGNLARSFGRGDCLILKGSDNPEEIPEDSNFLSVLYKLLQIPQLDMQLPPLQTRLLLKSRECRHVHYLYGSLNNVWPDSINSLILLEALKKAEAQLTDSLDLRPMLAPAIAEKFSLPVSGTQREWEAYSGIEPNIAESITETLPENITRPLLQTFEANEKMLTCQHRILLAALRKRHPASLPVSRAPRVSVLVQTYNQEEYIGEALDSILGQKTDFDVEIVVVDDASSDGTRAIVADYASRFDNIKPVFLRTRSNAGQNNLALFQHASAPYVALCDGDDYFTDPLKLQMQADFLDSHPECSICFHPVLVRHEDGSPDYFYPTEEIVKECGGAFNLDTLLGANFIQTNSVMYRWRFGAGIPDWFDPMLLPGDWYWHLLHAEKGEIGFINRVMSVYRRHRKSLFHREDKQSSVGHRMRFGLRELRTYEKVLAHFGKRAEKQMRTLANGVFADLTKKYIETEDPAPLEKAIRYFPEFGKHYLDSLKTLEES